MDGISGLSRELDYEQRFYIFQTLLGIFKHSCAVLQEDDLTVSQKMKHNALLEAGSKETSLEATAVSGGR